MATMATTSISRQKSPDDELSADLSPTETVTIALKEMFPHQVFEQRQAEYETLRNSYWAGNQKILKPRCFFQPHSAQDFACAVRICARASCAFAVKSGGHGHFAGQSCLEGGIQIDLVKLNGIDINREAGSVHVGTGCTWRQVYAKLQSNGLMAVGGRSADVGVGGFLIGGGIPFYAGERGWGIDNVRSFEVVLSDGIVAHVDRKSHPDLWRALRGGGANFGIITSFELEAFPYNGMWGGRTLVDPRSVQQAIEAYADFIPRLYEDQKGHTIIIFYYDKQETYVVQYLAYTQPKADSPLFAKLKEVPTLEAELSLCDYSDIAANIADLQGGNGGRMYVSALTVKLDLELLRFAFDAFTRVAKPASDDIGACMEFHALPRAMEASENVYNIQPSDGPLITLMIAFSSQDERLEDKIHGMQKTIISTVRTEAKERGLLHPFLFANYAAEFQDVVGSYRKESASFLASVAQKYDPDRVLQRLHQGSFKLNHAVPCSYKM